MPLLSIRIPASPDGKSNVYVELTKIEAFSRGPGDSLMFHMVSGTKFQSVDPDWNGLGEVIKEVVKRVEVMR